MLSVDGSERILGGRAVENVLVEHALPQYQARMRTFHHQLTRLNTSLLILQKINRFPFALLVPPEETIFFTMVASNFMDACLLIVTRLLTDTKTTNQQTLPSFKNWVLMNVRPEYKAALRSRLRSARFSSSTKTSIHVARFIRDTRVAHSEKMAGRREPSFEFFGLSELEELCLEMNRLFHALSFDIDHILLPIGYEPQGQRLDEKPDIEQILDAMAERSFLVGMAEREPDGWLHQKQALGDDALKVINDYRRKLGLPEA